MKLRIEKAIYGGAGLGRLTEPAEKLSGKAIFVPFTLPGEVVEATIGNDKRGYARANLQAVVEPSPERIEPPCEYFGRCGGCHYQHASYKQQLAMKQAILSETLHRTQTLRSAGISEFPEIEVLHADPWSYRNRIRLVVKALPLFTVGYREQRSHAMVAVTHCPVAAPLLQRAIKALMQDGSAVAQLCSEVELFTNGEQTSLTMTLLTSESSQPQRGRDAELARLCTRLKTILPELLGAVIFASPSGEDEMVDGSKVLAKWGEPSLLYQACGFGYRVSAGSFFQVNRLLVDTLGKRVTEARQGLLAWDLYAGVGLFARALTAGFEQVVAVESASSYEDLKHNLAGTSGRAVRATTRDFLSQQVRTKTASPDLIVVDPPRAGLGPEICKLLGELLTNTGAREIVYVSCDPATMSRDLGTLLQSGFTLQSLTLVDLFPQTFHMETVAVLARR